MSQFLKREYLMEDLQRWFEGAAVFSNTTGKAGFVQTIIHNEGEPHLGFELVRPDEGEHWDDDDVETGFENYGAVQLGPDAVFASRMPMRQYSFGLKTRQFRFYGTPGAQFTRNVKTLELVEQFKNRTTFTLPDALRMLQAGERRGCVLSDEMRVLRLYERNSRDAQFILVHRANYIGEVSSDGELRLLDAAQPFQNQLLEGVQL